MEVCLRLAVTTEYKGQLKRSTAEWHIQITLLYPAYSLQATGLIHGGCDNDTVAEHDVETRYLTHILRLIFALQLCENLLNC